MPTVFDEVSIHSGNMTPLSHGTKSFSDSSLEKSGSSDSSDSAHAINAQGQNYFS